MGKPAADTRPVHDRAGERLIVPSGPRVSDGWSGGAAATAATWHARPVAVARRLPVPSERRRVVADTVALLPAPCDAARQTAGSFRSCVIQAREQAGTQGSPIRPAAPEACTASCRPPGTASVSGLPENASVAEQNYAFAKEYAQSATSAWAPYDSC